MEKIELTLWIGTPVSSPGSYYVAFSTDMSGCGYVHVADHIIYFEPLPRSELIPKVIVALEDKQKEVRAKAEMQCRELHEQIQKLLSIDFDNSGL